jgi:hypothetical protein
MPRITSIFTLVLIIVTIFSQDSFGQFGSFTEEYCVNEQRRAQKMRKSIIKGYTRGKRAVSVATAERMATNIEIVVARQCASALRRKLSMIKYKQDSEVVILNAARNSIHDEHFDLTDSTIAENFFYRIDLHLKKQKKYRKRAN